MQKADIAARFSQLIDEFQRLPLTRASHRNGHYYTRSAYVGWATSAQALLRIAYGENAPHYRNFVSDLSTCNGNDYEVRALNSILTSAMDDFERGFSIDFAAMISGELIGDFVGMAKAALLNGHKDVAAVLACAALEDTIKRYCMLNDIDVNMKSLQDLVNALKSKGLVSGAQKSLLDTMPKIRDLAMHAHWAKIADADVGSVIGFVETFLMTKFPS